MPGVQEAEDFLSVNVGGGRTLENPEGPLPEGCPRRADWRVPTITIHFSSGENAKEPDENSG